MNRQIPEWALAPKKETFLFYDGVVRRYMIDPINGTFRLLPDKLPVGSELFVQPFDYAWSTEDRYGSGVQSYFDLAFLDTECVVSKMTLTRDHALNVYNWLLQLQGGSTPIALEAVKGQLKLEPEGTEGENSYHVCIVLGYEFVSEQQFAALRDFKASGRFALTSKGGA